MTSDAKNPNGFGWFHEWGDQFLVIPTGTFHLAIRIAWKMLEADLRAALTGLNIVEDIVDDAIRFVKEYRIDVESPLRAAA